MYHSSNGSGRGIAAAHKFWFDNAVRIRYYWIMKTCSDCKVNKPLDSFNKKGQGHQSRCRECQRLWYHNYYTSNNKEKDRLRIKREAEMLIKRKLVKDKKSIPCMDCGQSYPSYVMDFDHRDPTIKSFNIGAELSKISLQQLRDEINKCDVVCANCHRLRTYCSLV